MPHLHHSKMPLTLLTTKQCINSLQNYANTEVRSWNPFNLFRKRKLKNNEVAHELATILEQKILSDNDLLKIASAIDGFEETTLQHDLLCFLYSKIHDGTNLFVTKRKNITQINKILLDLFDKQYRPWWTLFLIELPYYSNTFRNSLKWFIGSISDLFTSRRTEIKQELISVYSNEEIVNQIINEYHILANQKTDKQDELNKILEISLEQTVDRTQRELIKEIKKIILTNLPFGELLISATALSAILTSYLSKSENRTKPKNEQAQEIMYIIGKVFLKANATQIVKSIIPGVSEIVESVVSVVASRSAVNPLHTDQQIGTAVASAAGGAVGGALGTVVPVIGTSIGAYLGAILSKTAATRFYQVLETWQTAPKGPKSIIPRYTRSFFSVFDNDAKNILEPIYLNYLETENISKKLGDEIARWLCIYTSLQNSGTPISEEQLEIIDEEMKKLKYEFMKLKNSHGTTIQSLYSRNADNPARVKEYIATIKVCLMPLHQPIIGMLNEYFSSTPRSNYDSYTGILKDLPAVDSSINLPPSLIITETSHGDLTEQLSANENDIVIESPAMR